MAAVLSWLDDYERRARLVPGLLALAPFFVLGIAMGLRNSPGITSLAGILFGIGSPVALTSLVRDRGQQLQVELWTRWGGPPTTLLLRVGSGQSDAMRDRRRSRLEAVTALILPGVSDETADPASAEQRYQVAIDELITLTRDKGKFGLVYEENKNYGYWRNLLAMKPFGVVLSSAGLATLGALMVITSLLGKGPQFAELLTGAVAMSLLLGFWVAFPTEDRVRRAGFTYAARLLDSTTVLAQEKR